MGSVFATQHIKERLDIEYDLILERATLLLKMGSCLQQTRHNFKLIIEYNCSVKDKHNGKRCMTSKQHFLVQAMLYCVKKLLKFKYLHAPAKITEMRR